MVLRGNQGCLSGNSSGYTLDIFSASRFKGLVEKFEEYGFELIKMEYSVHIIGQILDFAALVGNFSKEWPSEASDPVPPSLDTNERKGAATPLVDLVFASYRLVVLDFWNSFLIMKQKFLETLRLAMAVDLTLIKK